MVIKQVLLFEEAEKKERNKKKLLCQLLLEKVTVYRRKLFIWLSHIRTSNNQTKLTEDSVTSI